MSRYRLTPTAEQETILQEHCAHARYVWNLAVGTPFRLVAPPYQFDEQPPAASGPAPELGQHTEEVLLDMGFGWDQITAWREKGALG
jgi:crotonobetainyl-CoA:carnitine CoA-transferase CaiB-like acyl-CoA transferase